ncbi:carbohydrate ABC transporter permease [Paenibacillus sp. YN15]|uniref:carbohydrate ABC transporter permease n=1 Tax=Paenibacillus sp. YN15 TaxID=1742774 RepID=UPI000DCD51DB|nr:carbohydrate ABC transporter permease [Paenibacillus sp. YN15]RAV01413.1 ABC transporter permease [Paenibacillus sp. YN15]
MRIKRTVEDVLIDTFVYTVLILLSIATLLPFLQAITISVSPSSVVSSFGFHIIPTKFDFEGYKRILEYSLIWEAYRNTIIRTVVATALSVFLYTIGAYPLSKSYLPNRKLWTLIIIFTMYFSGGLIPSYLLVKGLGLYNSFGALILPAAVNTFTLIIVRNFFMTVPQEIEESARIDGANEMYILFKIVIPISMPIIATAALWSAVSNWNAWFDCMIYIKDQNKYVLQYVLRQILLQGQSVDVMGESQNIYVNSETMKMAALVAATLPIICTYPFLQKYFVKGMLIGSVKG